MRLRNAAAFAALHFAARLRLTPFFKLAPIVLICAVITDHEPAWAGPIERELIARGSNVGIPKPRPNSTPAISGKQRRLGNPLDAPGQAGSDVNEATTQSAQPETTKQVSVRKASDEISPAKPQGQTACIQALQLIAEAERVPSPQAKDPACIVEDPVVLSYTKSLFPIEFSRNLTLDCTFALALAKFSNDTAQALARHHMGSAIAKIHSGEGFVCRRRNNAPTGKLSEHSFGNATDWVGFTFEDGSRLPITDTAELGPDEAQFLKSVRTAACGAFTTVLGPGSNPAHSRHFHFDLGRSKGRKNPYRICE